MYNELRVILVGKKDKKEAKQKTERGEKMNSAMIGKIADMLKSISDLCKKVIDAGDPEKYAASVESLNSGVSDTYGQMRSIIVHSDKFTEDEKLKRLAELAKQEEESKKRCDEAIKGNRQQVANIALEVAKGLLTCGIYYVPGITKNFRKTIGKQNNAIEQGEDLRQLAEGNLEATSIVD